MTSSQAEAAIDSIEAALSTEADLRELDLEPLVVWARPSDGDSDILIGGRGDTAECIGCAFVADGKGTYVGEDAAFTAIHVRRHKNAGHRVPVGLDAAVENRWGKPA